MEILQVFLIIVLITAGLSVSYHAESIVFVIIGAENSNPSVVQDFAANISSQAAHLDVAVAVYNTSQKWPDGGGSWTYFPLLNRLSIEHGGSKNWVVFVESQVKVRLLRLLQVLHSKDSSELFFLGRGLQDQEETIIHHFAHVDASQPFLYPDSRSGMVLSGPLITRLAKKWTDSQEKLGSEINIDASYEFASFVKSAGVVLTTDPAFCIKEEDDCAIIYYIPSNCRERENVNKIHFAIKSWKENHKKRLPILINTWLKQVTNYGIYSDVEDSFYRTISVGVPNTKSGHCAKTLAIIQLASQLEDINWLFIADDDTLVSIEALSNVLGCHDHNDLVALGERYGYAAALPHGYDFITGGGGIVLSMPLVKVLASPGVCPCPSNDTPDDMFLGICLRRLSVPITHSSAFHQARPMDYSIGRLEGEQAVSFHKFWMVNPYEVYDGWLHSSTTKHPYYHQDEL